MTKNDNENIDADKKDHAKLYFTWSVLKYGKTECYRINFICSISVFFSQ